MMFADANLFVYAELDNTEKGDLARKFIELAINKNIKIAISVLVLDEIAWAVKKLSNYDNAIEYCEKIIELPNLEILSLPSSLVPKIIKYMKLGIKPRDAIHIATMLEHGIFTIVSDDSDFDKIKEIERLDFAQALRRFKRL